MSEFIENSREIEASNETYVQRVQRMLDEKVPHVVASGENWTQYSTGDSIVWIDDLPYFE